ncbi:uncharacterized protein ACRADG_007704 isoform 2-T3 [Cochliomyia hominivorax]
MDVLESNNRICRICLDVNVVLNWNNTLIECHDVTYKDCYYKYTQLVYLADDPYSPMLCESCLNILQNFHTLILKALESHEYFTKTWLKSSDINDDFPIEHEMKYSSTEFETILVEDENINKDDEEKCYRDQNSTEDINQIEETANIPDNETKKKSRKSKKNKYRTKNRIKTNVKINEELSVIDEDEKDLNKRMDKSKARKERMTTYSLYFLAKVFPKLSAAKLHEKTHGENRIRKETCDICGLKFFNKSNLRGHLRIHNSDREKKHKCDSCDKAFYNKSSLNIHRRIHLGQMIPCSLCSKEFLRQVDLDLHMNTHSATALNGVAKKRSRYWIRCKYCNKTMLSTSFRSHTAVHLNQPLMKCLLCDKEFFRRESCTDHLKVRHHKKVNEYNDCIQIYEKKRFSHLLLEQTADIIPEDQ